MKSVNILETPHRYAHNAVVTKALAAWQQTYVGVRLPGWGSSDRSVARQILSEVLQ